MYKVIREFTDLQDDGYKYKVGDTFPRGGVNVVGSRLAQLSSKKNRQGVPLIAEEQTKSPNSAIPAQRIESVERETPSDIADTDVKIFEKPKRGRKKTN